MHRRLPISPSFSPFSTNFKSPSWSHFPAPIFTVGMLSDYHVTSDQLPPLLAIDHHHYLLPSSLYHCHRHRFLLPITKLLSCHLVTGSPIWANEDIVVTVAQQKFDCHRSLQSALPQSPLASHRSFPAANFQAKFPPIRAPITATYCPELFTVLR